MIEVRGLTKSYGEQLAVDDVSFTVQPGRVTGFLGPNGAGKSTTMRMVAGLDRPTAGTAAVAGLPYREHDHPMRTLGVLLDAKAADPGRSARSHLRVLAAAGSIPRRRVEEVLELVGLTDVADRRLGSFSLGMGQRLGIATALLGDPEAVMLDEPVNGLDVDGIQWIRRLLAELAAEGRTVLLSSHLMSELEMVADQLVVIGKGRVLADTTMAEFLAGSSRPRVLVRTPEASRLAGLLAGDGVVVESAAPEELDVVGLEAPAIGRTAATHGIELHLLTPHEASLEEAYSALTQGAVTYSGGPAADTSRSVA